MIEVGFVFAWFVIGAVTAAVLGCIIAADGGEPSPLALLFLSASGPVGAIFLLAVFLVSRVQIFLRGKR